MWGWSWNEMRRLYFGIWLVVWDKNNTIHWFFSRNCMEDLLWKERKGKLCMVMEGIQNINMLLIFKRKITRLAEVEVGKVSVWLCDLVTVLTYNFFLCFDIELLLSDIHLAVSFFYFFFMLFASLFSFCHFISFAAFRNVMIRFYSLLFTLHSKSRYTERNSEFLMNEKALYEKNVELRALEKNLI